MRSKRPFILLTVSFSFSCLMLAAAWCGNNGLIGTWAATVKTPGERPATILVSYKADGTASQSTDSMGHVVKGFYTYTVKADHITETLTGGTVDGKPIKVELQHRPTMGYTFRLDGKTLRLNGIVAGREIVFTRVD